MTNSTPLSPAAQACVTAFQKVDFESGHFTCEDMWIISREVAAAALRAAADQVVPEWCLEHQSNDSEWQTGFIDANCRIRAELLAIATELEGAQ